MCGAAGSGSLVEACLRVAACPFSPPARRRLQARQSILGPGSVPSVPWRRPPWRSSRRRHASPAPSRPSASSRRPRTRPTPCRPGLSPFSSLRTAPAAPSRPLLQRAAMAPAPWPAFPPPGSRPSTSLSARRAPMPSTSCSSPAAAGPSRFQWRQADCQGAAQGDRQGGPGADAHGLRRAAEAVGADRCCPSRRAGGRCSWGTRARASRRSPGTCSCRCWMRRGSRRRAGRRTWIEAFAGCLPLLIEIRELTAERDRARAMHLVPERGGAPSRVPGVADHQDP